MERIRLNRTAFYILSFTWGIIYTTVGMLIAAAFIITGHRPKKWGWVWYFETGKQSWGGMEWGLVFVKDKSANDHIKNHEFGHAIQNCFFGPFMIFLVGIPSSFRYWMRRFIIKSGNRPKTAYEDIWFEGQATRLGVAAMKRIAVNNDI